MPRSDCASTACSTRQLGPSGSTSVNDTSRLGPDSLAAYFASRKDSQVSRNTTQPPEIDLDLAAGCASNIGWNASPLPSVASPSPKLGRRNSRSMAAAAAAWASSDLPVD